jgi:hypothetical protein
MITKKIGKISYGWNEAALKGKGWWYVLGQNDTFSRAASRAEVGKLGLPKSKDMPPKDVDKPRYYYDINPKTGKPQRKRLRTGSGYEEADVIRSKGLMQLASERMMGGEGLGKSVKGAIGDKVKASATNIKRMADPMNLLSKLPGIGKLAATFYGKKMGRSASDISYFTGVQAPPGMEEKEEGGGEESEGKKKKTKLKKELGGNAVGILTQIYQLMVEKFENDSKIRELDDKKQQETEMENKLRHTELIEAILKGKKPKDSKAKKDDSKGSIFEMIGNFIKNSFSKILGKIGPLLSAFGSGLLKLLGSLAGILGPLTLVVGGIIGGAKLIDKGFELLTGKSSDSYNKLYDKSTTDKSMQDYIKQRKLSGVSDKVTDQTNAKDLEEYKKTGKIKDKFTGKDVTQERLKKIDEYNKYKEFKKTDPYQQYKTEVEEKDFKGKTKPTFEEWKSKKGLPTGEEIKLPQKDLESDKATVKQVQDEYSESTPAEKLSIQKNTGMTEAQLSESQPSNLAVPMPVTPSPLGARAEAATMANKDLTAKSASVNAPIVMNSPTNVVNNVMGGGGGGSGKIRNDESVLTRIQYQIVRPV